MDTTKSPPSERAADEPEDLVLETRVSKLWLGEDGILHVVNHPAAEFDLADARANHEATEKILKGRRAPLLVDMRHTKSITREARRFFAGREVGNLIIARALLIGSPISKIIGNFFLGLNRPDDPTRLFTVESEALAWLEGFVEPRR